MAILDMMKAELKRANVRTDGMNAEQLAGAFDALCASQRTDSAEAYARMVKRVEDRWKNPTTGSHA